MSSRAASVTMPLYRSPGNHAIVRPMTARLTPTMATTVMVSRLSITTLFDHDFVRRSVPGPDALPNRLRSGSVLVAAAVCPHPPALVPQLAPGADEIEPVRAAAIEATRTLVAAEPEQLIIVGGGPERASYPPSPAGTFAGYGVDLSVRLSGAVSETDDLPLSLLVGAWLLNQAPWDEPARGEQIPENATAHECARIGAELASSADRVGLLVMGDGSAARTDDAPRRYDDRAEAFDRAVAESFRDLDAAALLGLDAELADELGVAGRAAWQVLAGAAGPDSDALFDAAVLYEGAPWGVGYLVAVWERHG